MATYSTREAAKQLGIHFITLTRYILDRKVPAPKVRTVSGVKFRVWKERDIDRVRELLPRIANGRRTRHGKRTTQTKKK
jgi:excisionase family DNA binding protein